MQRDPYHSLSASDQATINRAMRGGSWSLENYGVEANMRRTDHGVRTTAWTVYVADPDSHVYEVAQWSYGQLYRVEQVHLLSDGTFHCTCTSCRVYSPLRGFCNHVNRLTLHALRRLPTLYAPARDLHRWQEGTT